MSMAQTSGCSFRRFFQSADSDRDNFLARLFGSFNEEPVRIWCRDPDSPYEDLGRPTLTEAGEWGRGHTLDFALRSRRDDGTSRRRNEVRDHLRELPLHDPAESFPTRQARREA